ncbi:tudor domain-containing protein 1 isoform X2 [Pogoniulus pusillus]|uniref:tudor domain-containing protein 1 isoform X2 n=1 Tax=Pogoniulus pusillus TaxID=488313 RepID=UPI0030B97FA1
MAAVYSARRRHRAGELTHQQKWRRGRCSGAGTGGGKRRGQPAVGGIDESPSWGPCRRDGMSRSNLRQKKPRKSQYSFERAASNDLDKNLFSSIKSASDMTTCHYCGLSGSLRCSQCKQISYCSVDCQKKDWPAHRIVCDPIKENLSNDDGGSLPAKTEKEVYLKDNSASVDSLKTEKHVKKVMLSDLQTLGIKKAMEIQGKITEFKSPSEFYIQMCSPEVLDQMNKAAVKLQDSHMFIKEHHNAVRGEVCVVRCSLDQSWRRALVEDVDKVQKKAHVFYIDYGNNENIPFSCIKVLHKDNELLFPPSVIKCSLAKYDAKGWNEDTTNFSSHLRGKYCSVTVVNIVQEEMMLNFAVDVVFPDLGDCLSDVPSVMMSDLTPESNTEGTDSPRSSENYSKGSQEELPEDEECPDSAPSDAVCICVYVGDTFSGVVSSVRNPTDFFCQQMQSAHQLAELQVSLNQHCEKFPRSPTFRPAVGSVCCAQFTEDNLWYRAAVTTYVSEDTVTVFYIDFGNVEVLPLIRLHPLTPRLMDLPAQAIKCTLAGIKPPLVGWTTKAIALMNHLVKDKVLKIKVVDKDDSRSVVELVDVSVTPAINISSYLKEEDCADEKCRMAVPAIRMASVMLANAGKSAQQELPTTLPPTFQPPPLSWSLPYMPDTKKERAYKWIKLTLKQTVDVVVCTVCNPGQFYCQISNNDELLALNSLNTSLSEYCQKTPPNMHKPENGEPCCAFFSGDGNWYRALVKNVASHGNIKVHFVDYGNTEEVPLAKIRQISSSFLTLPFQGIKCWLSGIKPADGKWIPEATARFCAYTSGIKLQARVNSFSRDGAGMELIDNSTGHPKVINEMLTSENFAIKEYLQEISFGHWKSIELAIGETLPVRVTEVVGPDLFYAVPVQSKDKEKLDQQLTDLEDYCKSQKNCSFKPKLGEACCAKFSGDGHWYRAVVLKVSQSVVKVLLADCGNTDTLPFSELLPIADSHLKLPFQTIVCSLAGTEKVDWSLLSLDKLKEMLLNKCVKITMKGTTGNAYLVTVEKHCETGSLDVADKVVMEDLVKSRSTENSPTKHHGNGAETKCCCAELKVQLKKHERILFFLLNNYGNPGGFAEMNKLLEHYMCMYSMDVWDECFMIPLRD